MAIEPAWAGVSVAALAGLVLPAIRGYANMMTRLDHQSSALERIEKGQEGFKKDFDAHVEKDRVDFEASHEEARDQKASLGGLHAKVLTIQEKFGLVHHDPPVAIGDQRG